jgi:ornithine cyclodeaminase/alanine dehydrogenase
MSATIQFLYLSQGDVVEVGPTLGEAVDWAEEVLREHGAKRYQNPPKPALHTRPDAFNHAMPGYLPGLGVAGLKWVSGFSANPGRGLPAIMGLIVLNDVDTGQPLAVMDCAYITALRTAAVSGVAARHLANPDAAILGLVGAGVQGRYNLLMLNEVLPEIRRARVCEIDAEILERFIAWAGEQVPFPVEAAATPEQAIRGADVVVTATGKLDRPLFMEPWVEEGALVLPVHSQGWEAAMLDKADRLIVDDWGQFSAFLGPPHGAYERLRECDAELGEVVLGDKPGRQNRAQRILDFNPGIAIHDVAFASRVLERARAKGLGLTLTLQDDGLPFC